MIDGGLSLLHPTRCAALMRWLTWAIGTTSSSRPAGRGLVSRGLVMYIHHMVRTQLYLDEELHRRLKELARKRGRTVSELVRDAVRRAYGESGADQRLETLRRIAGLWKDRDDLGETDAYVRGLRRDTRRRRADMP